MYLSYKEASVIRDPHGISALIEPVSYIQTTVYYILSIGLNKRSTKTYKEKVGCGLGWFVGVLLSCDPE